MESPSFLWLTIINKKIGTIPMCLLGDRLLVYRIVPALALFKYLLCSFLFKHIYIYKLFLCLKSGKEGKGKRREGEEEGERKRKEREREGERERERERERQEGERSGP
jgi:hypothetical protein